MLETMQGFEIWHSSLSQLQDGTVRIWHGSTYRLEAVLSVSLDGVLHSKPVFSHTYFEGRLATEPRFESCPLRMGRPR